MTNILKKVFNWLEFYLSEISYYKIHTLKWQKFHSSGNDSTACQCWLLHCVAFIERTKLLSWYCAVNLHKQNKMVSNQNVLLKWIFYGWPLKRFRTNESSSTAHKYNTSYSLLQGSFPTMHMIFFPVHYIHGNHIILLMIHFIINSQYMTNLTIVFPVKMECGWNFSISGLKMVKSCLEKIF